MSRLQRLLATRAGLALKLPVRSTIQRLGYHMVPTGMDEDIFLRRALEQRQIELVIDVGANIGQFAHDLIEMGFSGGITSFEPGSDAFRNLARNSRGYLSWNVVNVALGAATTELPLFLSANSVSSSLLDVSSAHVAAAPSSKIVGQERAEVRTLDSYFAAETRSMFLKIDTQGYELEVLRGAQRTLPQVLLVQCELSFRPLYDGQADWREVVEYLHRLGFGVIKVRPGFTDPSSGECLQADFVFGRHK